MKKPEGVELAGIEHRHPETLKTQQFNNGCKLLGVTYISIVAEL